MTKLKVDPKTDTVVSMAVYKGDILAWVEQSIDSILNQSYQNHIVLLVIDGDISDELLTFLIEKAKAENKLMLIKGSVNKGLSACMNYCAQWVIEHAPSIKYFFRMDADDISELERLQEQVHFLQTHPRVSILGSCLYEVNEEGIRVGQRNLPQKHAEIMRFLPKRCSINHPTVAIRMEVFKQGHRYREGLMNSQDYFFWAELAAAGFIFANLSNKLLKFRRVNDFYKRRGLARSLNEFKARFYTMKVLNRYSLGNILYAHMVLMFRLMPAPIVKLAYKIDRYYLNKKVIRD